MLLSLDDKLLLFLDVHLQRSFLKLAGMRQNLWKWLQLIVFLGLSLALTWLAFSGHNLSALWLEVSRARPIYLLLSVGMTLLGFWARAVRWRLLLESAGSKVHTRDTLISLLNGYFVSLGVPRLGEVTRCGALNRLSGAPVLSAAGSVVAERAVDVLVLLLLTSLYFFLAGARIQAFFLETIGTPLENLFSEKGGLLLALAAVGFLGLLALYLLVRKRPGRTSGFWGRVSALAKALWAGLLSALRLRKKARVAFILWTLLIWISYYAAPLLALLALDMQGDAFFELGFAIFLFGSLARTVPLPAGSMGAYHFIVAAVMLQYGYTELQGLGLAALNHGLQTLIYLVTGSLSFAVFVWLQRRRLNASQTSD